MKKIYSSQKNFVFTNFPFATFDLGHPVVQPENLLCHKGLLKGAQANG